MSVPTICAQCVHHRSTSEIWYNNTCATASPEPKMNFTTGIMEEPRKVYCRDRNPSGECGYFEAKS